MSRSRSGLLLAGSLLAACSVFPERAPPPSVIETIEVDYAFAAGSPRSIQIPASSNALTVMELHVDPPARGERFEDGLRWLLLPDGIDHASLRCRLQHWVTGDAHDPSQPPGHRLFPGAQAVRYPDDMAR